MRIVELGFAPNLLPYREGWERQRQYHAEVADGAADACLLVEHEPVYTVGRRANSWDRPGENVGAEVVDIDRGGRTTWHGPGQLVAYPILRLPEPLDVVKYVRQLEDVAIETCAEFGVSTGRVEGRTGVWVIGDDSHPDRKICAIGVRVARGVTMHGLALNCNADLSWFDRIIPCGITDAGVTSLAQELGRDVTIDEVKPVFIRHLTKTFAPSRANTSSSDGTTMEVKA